MESEFRDLLDPPPPPPELPRPSTIQNVLAVPSGNAQQLERPQNDFIDDDDDDEEDGVVLGNDDVVGGDDDSDDERLMDDIAKLDRDVEAFKISMMDSDSEDPDANLDPLLKNRKRPRPKATSRKRRKLNSRWAAVEPSLEVTLLLDKASRALEGENGDMPDLDRALAIVEEVIRQNAETHRAWILLSRVQEAQGLTSEAIMSRCFAAHLKPRDFNGWIDCADLALSDATEGAREHNVQVAQQCYSAALRVKNKSLKARLGKANCALEVGASSVAAAEYTKVLTKRPYNIQALRHFAEAAFDTRNARRHVQKASEFYEQVIMHVRAGGQLQRAQFEWSDVMIYVEMLSFLKRTLDAALALRSLSRFMIGRQEETFWDAYVDDDREWDQDEERKREVEEYVPNKYPYEMYGEVLPLDLRAKLAIYRLRLGQNEEALRHLVWIPMTGFNGLKVHEYFEDSPFVIKDLANQLYENKLSQKALEFYEFHDRLLQGDLDPDVLIQKGRCWLDLQDREAAEDLFIQALEADDDNIEARYELAQLYEMYQEKEEAFVLVNEALRLAHDLEEEDKLDDDWNRGVFKVLDPAEAQALRRRRIRRKIMREKRTGQKHKRGARKQYVRRMVNQRQREIYEQNVTDSFRSKYQKVQELRARIANGELEVEDEWMAAAGDLVDDFRSFKSFYPWNKYLSYMGYGSFFKENKRKPLPGEQPGEGGEEMRASRASTVAPQGQEELAAMADRLQKNLAPREDGNGTAEPVLQQHDHRGIPFDQWLELFLEYAISLARRQKAQEAYIVCQSARDSIVYKSADNNFLIHVAWAACAIHASDEETCVAVARFFMRFSHTSTDGYRVFSALCRLCQSPVSWYSSGPAQKYILRQIKAMDRTLLPPELAQQAMGAWDTAVPLEGDGARHEALDVSLLMMYGHILLTSTSYTYALNYFLRAAALDPSNPMVNLSTGIAYVHYAMKRQAENRQFIIAQGMHYMHEYYDVRRVSEDITERLEAHYNIARVYHLLGIYHLAAEFYARVLAEATAWRRWMEECEEKAGPMREFVYESAFNMRTFSLTNGDMEAARAITEQWLVL